VESGLTTEFRDKLERIVAGYPERRAALLPVLTAVQEEKGSLNDEIIGEVAEVMGLEAVVVKSVASFYTLYRIDKPAKHTILVCQSVSCMMAGAEEILLAVEKKLGVKAGEVTPDGEFFLQEAECLACCGSAPAVQIDGRYMENATVEEVSAEIDRLRNSGQSTGGGGDD